MVGSTDGEAEVVDQRARCMVWASGHAVNVKTMRNGSSEWARNRGDIFGRKS